MATGVLQIEIEDADITKTMMEYGFSEELGNMIMGRSLLYNSFFRYE